MHSADRTSHRVPLGRAGRARGCTCASNSHPLSDCCVTLHPRQSGMTMKPTALILFAVLMPAMSVAETVRYPGTADALPHDKYVRVVSETESPIERTYIKSKDGLYVAAAIRKPKGSGPFPAIIVFHGAPGGRGLEQLVGWSRGDHGGPVWERFGRKASWWSSRIIAAAI